jgi:PIN domain nuclease of toxin-antitoxin system
VGGRAPLSRVLLDTHVLLWWLLGDERLPVARRQELARPETTVIVSAASGWEIATKHRLGKLPLPEVLVLELPRMLREQGFTTLDVSMVHALRAGRLAGDHRDPFDRMLAAQSILEGLPLLSADAALDVFGVDRREP